MIVVTLPKGFGQLSPEAIEEELSRRGIYRREEGEGLPAPLEPMIPESPTRQVVVVQPDGTMPGYEPYIPVIPREEPTPEEWELYTPVAPPEAPPPTERKISKTALIAGVLIAGGLLVFAGRPAVEGRPAPALPEAEEIPAPGEEEFIPEEEG